MQCNGFLLLPFISWKHVSQNSLLHRCLITKEISMRFGRQKWINNTNTHKSRQSPRYHYRSWILWFVCWRSPSKDGSNLISFPPAPSRSHALLSLRLKPGLCAAVWKATDSYSVTLIMFEALTDRESRFSLWGSDCPHVPLCPVGSSLPTLLLTFHLKFFFSIACLSDWYGLQVTHKESGNSIQ